MTPTTAGVMRLLERMVRESPEDVFWLQDRWKASRTQPWIEPGKPSRTTAGEAPGKRRRALVCAGAAPEDTGEDVAYEFASPGAGESAREFLARRDVEGELPLDFVLGGGNDMRRACRALGIVWSPAQTRNGAAA